MNDWNAGQLAVGSVVGGCVVHGVETSLDSLDIVSGGAENLSGIRGRKPAVFGCIWFGGGKSAFVAQVKPGMGLGRDGAFPGCTRATNTVVGCIWNAVDKSGMGAS